VAQDVLETVEGTHRIADVAAGPGQADGGVDHAGGDQRAQVRHEGQRGLGFDAAAGGADGGVAGFDRGAQGEIGAAAFDEDLQPGFARIQVGLQPLAAVGVQRQRGALGDRHAVFVFQAHAQHGQAAAVGGDLLLVEFDLDVRQRAGGHQRDATAAAFVAELVLLAQFQGIAAGAQGDADVFPAQHLVAGHGIALADAGLGDFLAIRQQGEGGTGRALDAHAGLGAGQHGAVFQADETEAVVQLVEFDGSGWCGRCGGGGLCLGFRIADAGSRFQVGAGGAAARLDGAAQFGAAAGDGEVGLGQFAILQVDEAAERVALLARRCDGQFGAGRQRRAVDLGDVGARTQFGEAVAAFGIGLRPAAVFQPDAHARDARFARIAQAVAVAIREHAADQEAFSLNTPAFTLTLAAATLLTRLIGDWLLPTARLMPSPCRAPAPMRTR
jgi:hypothetical protein